MSSTPIDTRQLRHVAMLVKHRNFNRAADALLITQPALTKSIRKLEDKLGVILFDRHPHDIAPTPYCDVLMEHATNIFAELDEIDSKLDQASNLQRGELKIGAGPILAQTLVSDAVSSLVSQYPKLRVEITIDSWHALTSLLREGDIHLFLADVEDVADQPDLLIERLPSGTAKSTFACRAEHPLARKGILTPTDLLEYPLALPRLPWRYVRWFMDHSPKGMEPTEYYRAVCRMTCESYSVLRNIVSKTNYITCGPEPLFREQVENGSFLYLTLEGFSELENSYGIVRLKNRTLPPSASVLAQYLPK